MNPILKEFQARNERILEKSLANADIPERLAQAMRYSTLSGGKRIRAMLVYAAGLAVDAPISRLDAVAAALECVHSYSLIHDDLPSMDDDNLRRGQATNHIKFDEATAILAGDALLTQAFAIISSSESGLADHQVRKICHKLASSAGSTGMVGGQMLDILGTEANLSLAELENMHQRKTAALISAAVICGALCSDHCSRDTIHALELYANNIGLAFQVIDDILDIESSTEELGKSSGADQALGKSTYPALIGLQESKDLAENLYQSAIASIDAIGHNTGHLVELAEIVVKRRH